MLSDKAIRKRMNRLLQRGKGVIDYERLGEVILKSHLLAEKKIKEENENSMINEIHVLQQKLGWRNDSLFSKLSFFIKVLFLKKSEIQSLVITHVFLQSILLLLVWILIGTIVFIVFSFFIRGNILFLLLYFFVGFVFILFLRGIYIEIRNIKSTNELYAIASIMISLTALILSILALVK